jgi:hypothetical protein
VVLRIHPEEQYGRKEVLTERAISSREQDEHPHADWWSDFVTDPWLTADHDRASGRGHR